MRNLAVVAGMSLVGLAVIVWVAWPERASNALEPATPATISAPTLAPTLAQNSTPYPNDTLTQSSTPISAPVNATAEIPSSTAASISNPDSDRKAAARARQRCETQCDQDNGQCNSEARQSRQQCSKEVSSGGVSPFSGRPEAFDYYCGYFDIAQCGTRDCAARLSRRYAECVQFMRGDITSRRFDCIRAQDQAQSLCRTELRDCRAQCE
jgi:hypothetical protein